MNGRRVALVAVAALAVNVVLGLLTQDRGPLGVDRVAFDVIDPVVDQDAREVVRVLTDLGSFPVVALVAAAGAVAASARDRLPLAFLLLIGTLMVVVLNSVAKEIWDRPRPATRFYDPLSSSFPSGHAAQAIVWIAAARVLDRRWLTAVAAALAVTIGASRLYLHVHYLTDVLGGFALGVALLAPVLVTRTPRP